jgi:peptide/nickel transport system permease protein
VLCIRVDELASAQATWDAEPVGAETLTDAAVAPVPTAGVSR